MLSNEQIERRRKGIGGSDARIVMYGGHEEWKQLYDEKIHGVVREFTPSQQLLLDLGHAVEPLCLREFDREVKPLVKDPPKFIGWKIDSFFFFSPDAITLDGHSVQAKFHTGDKSILDLAEYYGPQLMHEMLCVDKRKCYLAVVFGHYGRFMHIEVEMNDEACEAYLLRAMQFEHYLKTGALPEAMAIAASSIKVPRLRDHVWDPGDNMVAPLAAQVLETASHAIRYEEALKALKALVPDDAGSATWIGQDGKGLIIKVAKNGAKRWYPTYGKVPENLVEAS